MDLQRRQVVFFGRVQGVGFRYTAVRAAGGYEVTGYVRNLHDGSVECVVEGEAAEIDAFLKAIREELGHYIRDVQQTVQPATGRFESFQIRH
jgi:acylphosphatase